MNTKDKRLVLGLRIFNNLLYLSAQYVFAQRVGIEFIELLMIDLTAIPLVLMWGFKCPPSGKGDQEKRG